MSTISFNFVAYISASFMERRDIVEDLFGLVARLLITAIVSISMLIGLAILCTTILFGIMVA